MRFDLNNTGGPQKPSRPDSERLKSELVHRAESLFRDGWGEPASQNSANWRPRDDDRRSMAMRGKERGKWLIHGSGEGGNALRFFALYVLGWPDLPGKGDGAGWARFYEALAGWLGDGAWLAMSAAERRRRDEQDEAKRKAEDRAERAKKAGAVAAVRAAARPVDGTPAEAYLRSRGITQWPADAVAYVPPEVLQFKKGIRDGEYETLVVWARDDAGEIVGGQRVLLDSEGRRILARDEKGEPKLDKDGNPEKMGKPSFGYVGGAPARLPAQNDNADLIVAEGPETALAIWSVTGCETWAVFGASSFQSAPLPLDRRVILAPDQDAPVGTYPAGSDEARDKEAAAKAFDAAVAKHGATHPDLWIARAPEPEGSKRDLNDTLMRAGPEAVRQACAAAVRVGGDAWRDATYRAPTGTVFEARRRGSEGFDRWKASVLTAAPDSDAEAPVVALRVSTGVGKSYSAQRAAVDLARELEASGDPRSVMLCIPRHDLGDEYLDELSLIAGGIPYAAYRGRTADDPLAEGEKMCRRADEAMEVQRAGARVESTLCKAGEARCQFYEVCGYMRQKKTKARIWVGPHALLWREPPSQIKPAALVVDEDATGGAFAGFDGKPVRLSLDDLRRPLLVGDDIEGSADLADTSARLAAALQASGKRIAVETLRGAGLTAEEMGQARRQAYQAVRAPAVGPTSSLEALRAELARIAPDNRVALNRARLFGIIRDALNADMATVPGLLVEEVEAKDGERFLAVRLRWREEIGTGWKVPTLLASATARPEVLRAVWPALGEVIDAEAAMPHVTVRQVTDRAFGASSVCPPEDAGAEKLRHAASNRAWLRLYIEARHATFGGRTLVIGQQGLIDLLKREGLPEGVETAHFNALSGLDRWRDVRLIIQIGRPMPSPQAVEDMAEVLDNREVERVDPWYPLQPAHIDMRGSGQGPALGRKGGRNQEIRWGSERHPDELAEAIRWSICEGEMLQGIGRGRGVNRDADNPLQVDILAALPLPLAIDEAGTFDSFKPSAADLMAARGIMVPDTSVKGAWHVVAAILPDLFGSAEAARDAGKDRSRGGNPISTYIGFSPRESGKAEIRLSGARYSVPVLLRAADEDAARALLARVLPDAELRRFTPPEADHSLGQGEAEGHCNALQRAPSDTATRAHARETPPDGAIGGHVTYMEPVVPIALPRRRAPWLPAPSSIRDDEEIIAVRRMGIHGAVVDIIRPEWPEERLRWEQCQRVSPLMAALREPRAARRVAGRLRAVDVVG